MADRSDDELFARVRATMSRASSEVALIDLETLRALKTDWLYCLLAQVRDDTPEDIRCNIQQAIPICVKHCGLILDITASILFVAFGIHGGEKKENGDNSRSTLEELLASLNENIKVVSFDGDLPYGNIGTNQRMDYTILVPKFDRFIGALLSTEFGRVTELGSIS
jgi:hypothetical protein